MTVARPADAGDDAPSGARVLIVSADVGESHAAMARSLAEELEAHPEVESATVSSDFAILGPVLGRVLHRGFEFHLGQVKWSYDLAYRVFTHLEPARWFGEEALYRLGGPALARHVNSHRPSVVVSTYPVMTAVLARLRAAGAIRCPVAAVVGPLGGLGFWTHPAVDLHLLLYPEALEAVERLAGAGKARAVRPLVAPEFLSDGARPEAPAAHDTSRDSSAVLISGGGWGAGDLAGATEACLRLPGVRVTVVTGRNQAALLELQNAYGNNPRVGVLGFTIEMRDLLCSADVFVTSTAGLSCIEARLCGCPTICYGFAFGHVRDNTRALADLGLARVARTPDELVAETSAALLAGRGTQGDSIDQLPSAAEVTVALARGDRTARNESLDHEW